MKKIRTKVAVIVGLTALLVACVVPAWVTTVESIAETAVPIAGSIVDIVDPAVAPLVTLVETGFTALTKTLDTYKSAPTATNLQAVEAALQALETNESQLEFVAGASNTTDSEINGVLALISQAVTEIAADIPAAPSASMGLAPVHLHGRPLGWKAGDFQKAFNALTSKDPRFKGKRFKTGVHKLF